MKKILIRNMTMRNITIYELIQLNLNKNVQDSDCYNYNSKMLAELENDEFYLGNIKMKKDDFITFNLIKKGEKYLAEYEPANSADNEGLNESKLKLNIIKNMFIDYCNEV